MRHQREGDPPALLLVIDISVRSYNVGLEGFLSSHISGYLLLWLSTCYSGNAEMVRIAQMGNSSNAY